MMSTGTAMDDEGHGIQPSRGDAAGPLLLASLETPTLTKADLAELLNFWGN